MGGNRMDTQDRLIEATRTIIIEEGIEATTLEHICSEAGFTRGAFYSNFASKDSLLGALAADEYTALIMRLRKQVSRWENAGAAGADTDEAETAGFEPRGESDSSAGASSSAISRGNGVARGTGTEAHRGQLVMENLLYEALDAVGVDKGLFILHSEMLMRSIRDAEWGLCLLDLNREFTEELGNVLTAILKAAGREVTVPIKALTNSAVAIVSRAAGLAGWRQSIRAYREREALAAGTANLYELATNDEAAAAWGTTQGKAAHYDHATREMLEMVLVLLYSASRPID